MTNKKNNNENKNTHPEANEDLKVSESIPDSFKELLDRQQPHLEITEDQLLIKYDLYSFRHQTSFLKLFPL